MLTSAKRLPKQQEKSLPLLKLSPTTRSDCLEKMTIVPFATMECMGYQKASSSSVPLAVMLCTKLASDNGRTGLGRLALLLPAFGVERIGPLLEELVEMLVP